MSHKKLFRFYREEKLTACKRGDRKRAIDARAPMLIPIATNVRYSLNFVSAQFTDGREFRVLTALHDCTRDAWASPLIHHFPVCRLPVSLIGLSETWKAPYDCPCQS